MTEQTRMVDGNQPDWGPLRGFCGDSHVHPGHGQCDGFSDADAAALDVALYGNAYLLDGKRVPPQDVLVVQADCCTPELAKLYVCNQDGLVEAVAKLLDGALHLEDCYITPGETTCVCLIGKLRALLPLCNEPRVQDGKTRDTFWRCVRHVHPSTPDAHVFGQV